MFHSTNKSTKFQALQIKTKQKKHDTLKWTFSQFSIMRTLQFYVWALNWSSRCILPHWCKHLVSQSDRSPLPSWRSHTGSWRHLWCRPEGPQSPPVWNTPGGTIYAHKHGSKRGHANSWVTRSQPFKGGNKSDILLKWSKFKHFTQAGWGLNVRRVILKSLLHRTWVAPSLISPRLFLIWNILLPMHIK